MADRRSKLLIYGVVRTDEDAMHWPEEDIGNLRVVLNALVLLFRM
jgi:hypothetical protein